MSARVQKNVSEIINRAKALLAGGNVLGVCEHTDDVTSNDIYIARGAGVDYIDEAFSKGAVLVVCDKQFESDNANVVAVEYFDDVVRALTQEIYREAVSSVKLIGITGTNGKTSVACIASDLLNRLGVKTGYIGTLGYGIVGQVLETGRNTTPDVVTLYRNIDVLYRQGCECVALEVSSHGIALQRIHGLGFAVGVFTNLSRDHMDFHGTMDNYRDVKKSLFTDYDIAALVVNSDDSVGAEIYHQWMQSKSDGAIQISANESSKASSSILVYKSIGTKSEGGSQLEIKMGDQAVNVKFPLAGNFNHQNVMLAIAICMQLGHQLDGVSVELAKLSVVPGRMESHISPVGATIYIDYAHTPAGVTAVLADETVRSKQNWVVLGCGGDRDKGKRPLMASAAAECSDTVIYCDDNVRHDSATQIILDMLSGVSDKQGTVVCRDRQQAIEYAINNTGSDSSLFLLGKGDESVVRYGDVLLQQADRDVVAATREAA